MGELDEGVGSVGGDHYPAFGTVSGFLEDGHVVRYVEQDLENVCHLGG